MQNRKIAFLDRDGVINKKAAEHCYITKVEDFVFNEGIFTILDILKRKNFEFIVVTNQRGIARGLYDEKRLDQIHRHMIQVFKENNISILDILYCPHDSSSCDCRKPKDGMLKKALCLYPFSISESLIISDSMEDIEMGKKFGLGTQYFVDSDKLEKLLTELKK